MGHHGVMYSDGMTITTNLEEITLEWLASLHDLGDWQVN